MSAAAFVREVDEAMFRSAEAPMRYPLAEHGHSASSFNASRIVSPSSPELIHNG